jgi:hypothetical protein
MADLKSKKGTKLSKAVIDNLTSEVEVGYDLSRAKRQRVGPGRPSLAVREKCLARYLTHRPTLRLRLLLRAIEEGRRHPVADPRRSSRADRDSCTLAIRLSSLAQGKEL